VGRSAVLVLQCCVGKLGESEMGVIWLWLVGWSVESKRGLQSALGAYQELGKKKISKVHVYDSWAGLGKGTLHK